MIKVRRDGTEVVLQFTTDLPHEKGGYVSSLPLAFDTGHTQYAELLRRVFRDAINSKLAAIRKAAYDQGWKDAKSRARKRRDFCISWHPENVGS